MSKPPPLPSPPIPKQSLQAETSFRLFWLIAASSLLGLLLSIFLVLWLLRINEAGQRTASAPTGGSNSHVEIPDSDDSNSSTSSATTSTVSEQSSETEKADVQSTGSTTERDSAPGSPPPKTMDEGVSHEESALLIVKEKPRPTASRSGSLGTTASGLALATKNGENPFFGKGSPAKSTVFVIDISGSMQTADRLPRVVASLKRAIDHLTPDQSFMVVLFDETIHFAPSSNGLVLATKKNIDRAYEWLDMPHMGGGTNPLPAMLFTLQLSPERIVLLSDGEFDPTIGYTVTQANSSKEKPAKIDCVGLMEEVEVLKQIASSNEGIYYQAN